MTDSYDASDPKAVRDVIKSSKSSETLAREGLRETMQSEHGRKWLHKLLLMCDPYHNPFDANAAQMAFRCGEMNIGLQLIAEMHEVSPELYLQIMKENK